MVYRPFVLAVFIMSLLFSFKYVHCSNKIVMKLLIISSAIGYNWENIKLFIYSLRNNDCKSDLILFVLKNDYYNLKEKFIQYNIKPILIEEKYPFYSSDNILFHIDYSFLRKCSLNNITYSLKWNVNRFSILNCWLLKYGKKYSHIYSLDVRDIVFQGNLSDLKLKNGVYVVEETKTNKVLIKDDTINNLNWVKKYKNYESITSNKILNSGTIFGSTNYFIPFIKQFCKFLKENSIDTAEQGSLNYAYYSKYFKHILFNTNKNQRGIVLTVILDLNEIILLPIKNGNIMNEDGTLPYIVHQYDRYWKLVNMYRKKYFLN